MKKLLFAAILTGMVTLAFAQHETLFNNARVVGAFGGPITEFGISDGLNTAYGGGGGIVIGNAFLGCYGMGSVDLNELIDGNNIDQIELAHGGFWVGYTYQPYKLLHVFSTAKIGWGAVNVKTDNFNLFEDRNDDVFVLTPELGLELNIFKWFRLAGTAGYRWVNGTSAATIYNDEDFSGFVSTVSFRFGWFGNRRF